MSEKHLMREALPFDATLANAFRRTRVTIDVSNAGLINGFSAKLFVGFAAGGFVLTNRKSDIVRVFGQLADEICYNDSNELSAKLEHFIAHDRQRLEVTREIQAIVRRDYTTEALFARTIPAELERLKAQGARPGWKSRIRRAISRWRA